MQIATVGETLITVQPETWANGAGPETATLDAVLQKIEKEMSACRADVTVLRRTSKSTTKGGPGKWQTVLSPLTRDAPVCVPSPAVDRVRHPWLLTHVPGGLIVPGRC